MTPEELDQAFARLEAENARLEKALKVAKEWLGLFRSGPGERWASMTLAQIERIEKGEA